MASSATATVDEYLAELPADRREAIQAVRDLVNRALARRVRGGHPVRDDRLVRPARGDVRRRDNGRPLAYVGLASQKRAMSVYLSIVYGDAETDRRFRDAWGASGKKLDTGKSCVRF